MDGLRMILTLALAVTCYSLQDIKDARCEALCRRDLHTTGRANPKKLNECICEDRHLYEDLRDRHLNLGPTNLQQKDEDED